MTARVARRTDGAWRGPGLAATRGSGQQKDESTA